MEKTLIISGPKDKPCSRSGGEIQYFNMIPSDLVINEIFSRLSVKSMGKCRCVSKLWSLIFCPPNYKQLFPTKSPDPPRLLFTFAVEKKLFFYTSTQPQNPDENSSLVATHHHTDSGFSQVSRPVHGLVCYQRSTRDNSIEIVVLNPITGQYVALPKMAKEVNYAKSYLGYDPIDKQFKVFCIHTEKQFKDKGTLFYIKYKVLTLENGRRNHLWREIKWMPIYGLINDAICINGVLYYTSISDNSKISCFDVRSETFDTITKRYNRTMINYKGKLGVVDNSDDKDFMLWVLEDAREDKWSKHVYEKPMQWREINSKYLYAVGVSGRGEIVFGPSPNYGAKAPYYIYFYNLEKNTVVELRVEFPEFNGSNKCFKVLKSFPNYVADEKLM